MADNAGSSPYRWRRDLSRQRRVSTNGCWKCYRYNIFAIWMLRKTATKTKFIKRNKWMKIIWCITEKRGLENLTLPWDLERSTIVWKGKQDCVNDWKTLTWLCHNRCFELQKKGCWRGLLSSSAIPISHKINIVRHSIFMNRILLIFSLIFVFAIDVNLIKNWMFFTKKCKILFFHFMNRSLNFLCFSSHYFVQ